MVHYVIVLSSCRILPAVRCGRVLLILGLGRSVSVCKNDGRFHLLPFNYSGVKHAHETQRHISENAATR